MTRELYLPDTNRLQRMEKPDGDVVDYAYEVMGDRQVRIVRRFDRGGVLQTVATTVRHRSGAILEMKSVDAPSGVVTRHRIVGLDGLDRQFRVISSMDQITGKLSMRQYTCCGLEWEVDGDGRATRNEYDALGRLIRQRNGYKDALDPGNTLHTVLTDKAFQLDGEDRRLATRSLLDLSSRLSTQRYNLAREKMEATHHRSGIITRYRTVMLPVGGRIELTSLPKSGHDERHRITSWTYSAEGKLIREMTYASTDPFATKPDPGTLNGHRFYEEGRRQ